MSKIASIFRFSLSVVVLLLAVPLAAHAGDVECSDKEVSARGPSFTPSPETSMEAAKTEWLKKATEIYSDATMETAKNPEMTCASQGLYSNCTITAFPCGLKPVAPKN
jgi:hypothetical protein